MSDAGLVARRDDPERGSGTVLTLAVVAVVLLCAGALAALGAAQQARSVARTGADLGALAAATALRWGQDACATAQRTVERNGGDLVGCDVEGGGVVTVTVQREVAWTSAAWPGAGVAEVVARAGPRPAG